MEKNIASLGQLNVESTVHLLRRRWESAQPYTIGGSESSLVIAVNPLNPIPNINGKEAWEKSERGVGEPHIYSVSSAAISRIHQGGKSQSILVSGESGSGKTESTRILLEHLENKLAAGPEVSSVSEKVFRSNPLLEAFGNASTFANDNSSRFGRIIELRVNPETKKLSHAQVGTFLFETSRIMNHPSTECNFHIFYQLLAGVESDYRLKMLLGLYPESSPQSFNILRTSEPLSASRNAEYFRQACETLRAMSNLQLVFVDRLNMMKSLAIILHLGNLQLDPLTNEFSFSSRSHGSHASRLLGYQDSQHLEQCLRERMVTIRGEKITMSNNQTQFLAARDSLGKEIYMKVFNWLVRLINNGEDHFSAEGDDGIIRLLDVMGFESMSHGGNSLEQLLINYANEKLQFLFVQNMILQVEEEYFREGLSNLVNNPLLNKIEFERNEAIIQCFDDSQQGLWALLHQESLLPGGSDVGFAKKIGKTHFRFVETGKLLKANQFAVRHFAARVEYSSDLFLEKNQFSLSQSIVQVLDSSSLLDFFNTSKIQKRLSPTSNSASLGVQAKLELDRLLKKLQSSTDLSWIRCIRPNADKSSFVFNEEQVRRQIRTSGVLSAIEVSRNSYPVRFSIKEFVSRFGGAHQDQGCTYFKPSLSLEIQFGKNFVYLSKAGYTYLCHLQSKATLLQSCLRMFLLKRDFKLVQKHVKSIQNWYRRVLQARKLKNSSFTSQDEILSSASVSTYSSDDIQVLDEIAIQTEISNLISPQRQRRFQRTISEKDEHIAQLLKEVEEQRRFISRLSRTNEDNERRIAELENELWSLRFSTFASLPTSDSNQISVLEANPPKVEAISAVVQISHKALPVTEGKFGTLRLFQDFPVFRYSTKIEIVHDIIIDLILDDSFGN